MQLRIGWVLPTAGIFGAVREVVEVSNVLVQIGHQVTIYHPAGTSVRWLANQVRCGTFDQLMRDKLDVLIGVVDWQPDLFALVRDVPAQVKGVCLLGFDPVPEMAQALRGEIAPRDQAEKILREAMGYGYTIFSDSQWQRDWLEQEVGYPAGPSFGGINLQMFVPGRQHKKNEYPLRIIYSNDPRPRKGTDTVKKALDAIQAIYGKKVEIDSYWGKGLSQPDLVKFYQAGDIFVDGHRRAGWCNPVLEAMACGCVPVCTQIGATQEFALPGVTAEVVPVDAISPMVIAVRKLIDHHPYRQQLRQAGIAHAQQFSYAQAGQRLAGFLQAQILQEYNQL